MTSRALQVYELAKSLAELHTGNGETIAQAVEALIDARVVHLQGVVDRVQDQLTVLRAEVAQLQALKEGVSGEKKTRP